MKRENNSNLEYFYHPHISDEFCLSADESHHAIRVLRLRVGDELMVTDGQGTVAHCVVRSVHNERSTCGMLSRQFVPEKKYHIHLGIAPTKSMDKMEWMIEKCVEVGVDAVTFLYTSHSERKKINLDRIQKRAVAAMKQSQQCRLPLIKEITAWQDIVHEAADEKCIAHRGVDSIPLSESVTTRKKYIILIGPEGDFTADEVSFFKHYGCIEIALGPNRLRTETAGLVACHTLTLLNTMKR